MIVSAVIVNSLGFHGSKGDWPRSDALPPVSGAGALAKQIASAKWRLGFFMAKHDEIKLLSNLRL
jgi:hypothetical protein